MEERRGGRIREKGGGEEMREDRSKDGRKGEGGGEDGRNPRRSEGG